MPLFWISYKTSEGITHDAAVIAIDTSGWGIIEHPVTRELLSTNLLRYKVTRWSDE